MSSRRVLAPARKELEKRIASAVMLAKSAFDRLGAAGEAERERLDETHRMLRVLLAGVQESNCQRAVDGAERLARLERGPRKRRNVHGCVPEGDRCSWHNEPLINPRGCERGDPQGGLR